MDKIAAVVEDIKREMVEKLTRQARIAQYAKNAIEHYSTADDLLKARRMSTHEDGILTGMKLMAVAMLSADIVYAAMDEGRKLACADIEEKGGK